MEGPQGGVRTPEPAVLGGGSTSIRRDLGTAERRSSPRLWSWLVGLFLVLAVVFSAIPLGIDLLEKPNKDYSLWYQVGALLRQGMDLYPDPSTGRLFPFMYPPSAAAMLGYLSVLGKHGTTLVLVLAHSAAWAGAIVLSVWLATGGKVGIHTLRQRPLLAAAPSLAIVALVHNTYLLGQPNLGLLTLLLLAFAYLRQRREITAGVLVATAAAIKAFPILALGYFVYRRMWRASAATVLALVAWLLVAPLPFRTPAQALADVTTWSQGMLFTYNSKGIAQRPYRSFSYKNQSIMALAHRLLRDVPADGEKVLTEHVAARLRGRSIRGMTADGSIDLAAMLTAPPDTPRWNENYEGVDAALRKAWRVNVLSLNFRAVTAVTLAAMLALALFVASMLPARKQRTADTDAIEFALVTLLIVMFSPLSFNYAFVWLIYPLTVALNVVRESPAKARWRNLERTWVALVFGIPATAIAFPLYAQAYGNLFVPALLLVIGLGVKLHALRSAGWPTSLPAASAPLQSIASRHSITTNCSFSSY